ncbi:dienelactone hydrolase family protein [Neotabrizicola shimadae]|uniref:Dienelactone hydrolase family protein n=1 Tax=Neotabrizicola shimadae TaxID=2807096 RepID=A0A8G0ZVG0_9RHOB|nr:dienelactone hydrolase family protein [Neotabrizicola shimadae]QYZ69577.1 dienelactone hydrolase family protein [Neotabrizicola shimadae]
MHRVTSRDHSHDHGETRLVAQVFTPDTGGPRPGLLVVHGARGLDPFILSRAQVLAEAGYTVLAADLWGGRQLLSDPAEIGAHLSAFAGDRALWIGRLAAARAALAGLPECTGRIGALGYCFGGTSVLEMLRAGLDLAGVVSFHAGLDMAADDWSGARGGKALLCTGAEDPLAAPDQLARVTAAMTGAGVDWQAHVYGGVLHGFTEPDGPGRPPFARHDARADRRSWAAMMDFFAETLAPETTA